jgi:hypothetical protein
MCNKILKLNKTPTTNANDVSSKKKPNQPQPFMISLYSCKSTKLNVARIIKANLDNLRTREGKHANIISGTYQKLTCFENKSKFGFEEQERVFCNYSVIEYQFYFIFVLELLVYLYFPGTLYQIGH